MCRQQLALEDLSVLRCLDEGRFSKVLLVSLQEIGTTQALRVVPREALCSRRRQQRSILEKVEHPFVVRHLQVFEQPNSLCFLQEHCPYGDLTLLLRAGALAEHEARPLLGELLLALEFLHGHGITYRDLRPETVLFCRQRHAKLADLNVAVPEPSDLDSVYVAPESCAGGRAVDWYSLGAVASHALEGRAPPSRERMVPKSASMKAQNFVASLTKRERTDRLGSGDGDGCDVRCHMFFAGVCFEKLLASQPCAAPWRARLLALDRAPGTAGTALASGPLALNAASRPRATGQPLAVGAGSQTLIAIAAAIVLLPAHFRPRLVLGALFVFLFHFGAGASSAPRRFFAWLQAVATQLASRV